MPKGYPKKTSSESAYEKLKRERDTARAHLESLTSQVGNVSLNTLRAHNLGPLVEAHAKAATFLQGTTNGDRFEVPNTTGG